MGKQLFISGNIAVLYLAFADCGLQLLRQLPDLSPEHRVFFFEYAEKTTWFDSTVFVLIGDHGTAKDATYPLPLSYFHTPLIFYAPNIIRPEIKSDMASQIDVFPTIMGILKLPHTANHLGINLLKEQRQYSCVMNSAGYAILDKEWMMVGKRNTDEKFFMKKKTEPI